MTEINKRTEKERLKFKNEKDYFKTCPSLSGALLICIEALTVYM
jgi:hypothetical protein